MIWPLTRGFARGFFAGSVACLFVLQALAFVFSSNGRVAFASGDGGASIAMAGEICHAAAHDGFGGDKAPSPDRRHRPHCALCVAGHRDLPLPAVGLIVAVIVFVAPLSDEAPARFFPDDMAPPPLGWASSWSSRAPPPIA